MTAIDNRSGQVVTLDRCLQVGASILIGRTVKMAAKSVSSSLSPDLKELPHSELARAHRELAVKSPK